MARVSEPSKTFKNQQELSGVKVGILQPYNNKVESGLMTGAACIDCYLVSMRTHVLSPSLGSDWHAALHVVFLEVSQCKLVCKTINVVHVEPS